MYAYTFPVYQSKGDTSVSIIPVEIVSTGGFFRLGPEYVKKSVKFFESKFSLVIDIDALQEQTSINSDFRSTADHISDIRSTLKLGVSELASIIGVSRQAVYKWVSEESTPDDIKLNKLKGLSEIADRFKSESIDRGASLIKMKTFNGRSFIDLVKSGENSCNHMEALIEEAKITSSAYKKSGLIDSKTEKTNDWQSSISISGRLED